MHGQGKIRIGFLVALPAQGGLVQQCGEGARWLPLYIPSMAIKCQTLKDPSSFFRPSLLSHLSGPLLLPLISLERRDYWHAGIQKWHLLKIKRLSQAANLMRVGSGGRGGCRENEQVPFQLAEI